MANHNATNRLRVVADELRSIALELGPSCAELINCVGIINATRSRLAVEAGLDEMRDARPIDTRIKVALLEGKS